MRKTIFLLALLLIIPFITASLDVSETSLLFGGSSSNPEQFTTKSFILDNPSVSNYTNLDIFFEINSEFGSTGFDVSDFTENLPDTLDAESSANIELSFEIPHGFKAYDEDNKEEKEFLLGTLKITGDNDEGTQVESDSIDINLQVENNLKISGLELKSDAGTENVRDGSTKTIEEDQEITFTVGVQNDFSTDLDTVFEAKQIEAIITITNLDDEENKQDNDKEIPANDKGEIEIKFDVDSGEDGSYDVEILLIGEDEHGGIHGDTYTFTLDVKEKDDTTDDTPDPEPDTEDVPDNDGDSIDDLNDFCPNTVLTCTVDANGCPTHCPIGSDGCKDDDDNGTCDRIEKEEKKKDKEDLETTQDDEDAKEDVEKEEKEDKKDSDSSGFMPFLIGFVIGVVVTFCFMLMIKVD